MKQPVSPTDQSQSASSISPAAAMRMPKWLKRPIPGQGHIEAVRERLGALRLHTVCAEARCPNRAECFGKGTATFLILGDRCTRNCRFCAVTSGSPLPPDPDEPSRVFDAVKDLHLRYAVITSVTRDDLADGGAGQFASVVQTIRQGLPSVKVEVLIPDFKGDDDALAVVCESAPDVLNHNVETVPRLYPSVRPQAGYHRSLQLLERASHSGKGMIVKSGLMVGLGERADEVELVLKDLRTHGVAVVTIGQYLAPSKDSHPVVEYVDEDQFARYRDTGLAMGFSGVFSGPFVRSSYMALEVFEKCRAGSGDDKT